MPDTKSPDDALTPESTKPTSDGQGEKSQLLHLVQKQAGTSKGRARLIREGKISSKEAVRPTRNRTSTTFKPMWDAEQLRQKLQKYDRTPFLDILAIWMECAPTPQTIMAFADRYPDRWTKAMVDLGRLGGFADKKEIDMNFGAEVARMSDSQVEDKLRDFAYRLGIPLPKLLQLTAIEIDSTDAK